MNRFLEWLRLRRPREETLTPIVFMPLNEAYLCRDFYCSTISNCAQACPICWSGTHPIASFIDRETEAR